MSRLQAALALIEAQEQSARNAAAVAEQLSAAHDAFELAARCAEGAWNAREKADRAHLAHDGYATRGDTIDAALFNFELGYRVACAELAVILRAMRKGEPPTQAELASAWEKVEREIKDEMGS